MSERSAQAGREGYEVRDDEAPDGMHSGSCVAGKEVFRNHWFLNQLLVPFVWRQKEPAAGAAEYPQRWCGAHRRATARVAPTRHPLRSLLSCSARLGR